MAKNAEDHPVRFIHTADWQIGKPYARVAEEQKRSLLQLARIDTVKHIGKAAADAGAAFVLVAGDLFDSPHADQATVSAACGAIGQIGIPVVVIPGNHDHGGPGSVWSQDFYQREQASLAPNLVVLLDEKPLELDSAVILPCPLLHRAVAADPSTWLRSRTAFLELPTDKPRIVLAHGSTQNFAMRWDDDDETGTASNLIDLTQLPAAEIDYIALGDWHGTREVGPGAWYSGTPEIDRFPKGGGHDPGNILIVDAARGRPAAVVRLPTGRIRWHELAFDFADDSALDELETRLVDLLGQRTNEDLLRLTISGSIGIEATARLEQMLQTLTARLLRLKLDDQTAIAPTEAEIEALTGRDSDPLIARVAGRLVELAGQGTDETALTARTALRELHAACGREAAP